MNIEIRCNNCDKNLHIVDTAIVPGVDTIRFEVLPCGNIDCNNCKDCEDLKALMDSQEELYRLKKKLAEHEAIP